MVYLGSTLGAEGVEIQPPVMGDNLNILLEEISKFFGILEIAFSTAIDSNGAPIASLQSIAGNASTLSKSISELVKGKNLLSKNVKIS